MSTYPDLAGKTAVVTGGSRGIGAATAEAFAASGATVVAIARDKAALAGVVESLRALNSRVLGIAADCTDEAELAAAAHRVHEEVGPADILVAFAGGNGAPAPSRTETAGHWRQVLDGNLTATFLTVAAFFCPT